MLFFTIFIIIFLGRAGSSIFGYELLNTDEFIIGAKAMRLIDGYPITQFDGATSGILNAIFLTWPNLFNLDISYISIRISGILAISLIIYFTFKIVSRCVEKKFSIALIFPLVLFFAFTKDPDFLHYSNELISILLILISLNYYFSTFEKQNSFNLIISSMSLGLVLFAKMQFFPVACLIIFFINYKLLFIDNKFQNAVKSSIAFLFPTIFFSIYYFFDNEFQDLFYNVIHFPLSDFLSRNQIAEKDLIVGSNSIKSIIMSSKKTIFANHLILNSVFHLIYVYFFIFLFFLLKILKGNVFLLLNSVSEFRVLMLISIIIATMSVIIVAGSVHRHYLINLIPILPIFLGYLIKDFKTKGMIKKNIKYNPLILVLFLLFLSILFENKKFYSKNFVHKKFNDYPVNFDSPEILRHLRLKKDEDKAIVWGWKPEIYLLSGLTPSNREATNLKQIDYRNGREYYRQRFIREFDNDNPAILIDYAKSKAIFYNNENNGVNSFEKLRNKLKLNYKKIVSSNNNCPDYYLRNDKYEILKKSLINFSFGKKEIKELNKLKDFNTDEKMCDTEVIFSNKTNKWPNVLSLKLDDKNIVSEIMLLAAAKNDNQIILNFEIYNNKILKKKGNLKLKKKPYWSTIKFENKIKADHILIKLKNLKKYEYGIDEIKIY